MRFHFGSGDPVVRMNSPFDPSVGEDMLTRERTLIFPHLRGVRCPASLSLVLDERGDETILLQNLIGCRR